MTEHSRMIGGSSSKRVINCPGSWALGNAQPPKPSSSYADEGTLLHDAMAMILDGEVDRPEDVIGLDKGEHIVTQALFDEMIRPALDVFESIPFTSYAVESRVGFPSMPGEFGTADVVGVTDEYTVVLDWKFGRGVYVSPINNTQLKYYGAAARYSHPEWFTNKPVRLYIVQPGFPGNELHDEIGVKDLRDFERTLKQTTRTMKKKNAPFKAGSWCLWCPAGDVCPLKTKMAVTALKNQGDLAPEELGRWLKEDAPRLEELIKDRRETARAQLEAGHKVPGMKLVYGREGQRVWRDPEEIEQRLRGLGRKFKVSDFYKHSLHGPAPIEKLLKSRRMSLDVLGDDVITRASPKLIMVTDDAKGEEVPSMAQVFKAMVK